MAKGYLSNRQRNLKVGINSYTENSTVLDVTGKVGIGTTNARSSLDIEGSLLVSGVVTATTFNGQINAGVSTFTGITTVTGSTLFAKQLNVSGVSTIGNFIITPVGSGAIVGTAGIVTYYGDGSQLNGLIANTIQNIDDNQTYYPLLSPSTSGTISSISVSSSSIVFNPGPNNLGIGSTQPRANLDILGTIRVSSGSTFDGAVQLNSTLSQGNSAATFSQTTQAFTVGSQTSGALTLGGTSQTGTITLGRSIASQTTNIQAGISGIGTTKTINFGTGGGAGSFTNINIGPTAGVGTVLINTGTNLGIGSATPTSKLDVVGDAKVSGVVTATTFIGALTGTATTATKLATARTFEITGDIVASPISFDGTGNVSLAATIQPNSVGLGTDTTGDYVTNITGTSNQITVTSGTGEGSTPTLSIPSQFTAPQDVTVTRDLQVNRNLNVTGNITIGGTTAFVNVQELVVTDPDIVLGYRTDTFGNDVSNDTTANHGGVALASTEGSPLVNLFIAGIETAPATYKKIMWFKSGTFSGLGTDAWLSNYAIGIGSTQFPTGTRLAAGNVQFTQHDLSVVRNINSSGIVTAVTFSGQINSGVSTLGVTTSTNLTAQQLNVSGLSTFAGITTVTGTTLFAKQVNVSGVVTSSAFIKIGGTSSQFLKADGSVDTNNYIAAETDTLNTVTTRGNTTTNGISVGVLTATSGNFSGIITSSGVNVSGVVTAVTFNGQVNAGVGTITSLNSTSAIITNLSGTNLNYSGIGTLSRLILTANGAPTTPQLQFTGSTSAWIDFGQIGVGVPAFTTRSAGTKLVLWNRVDGSNADYAFGISSGPDTLWSSVSSPVARFAWYAGTSEIASLSGTGNLNISGVVTAVTFNGQVNAGVGTITTLSGTTATYTNGNLTTLNVTTGNIVTGVVTTLSGTTATYTTGNFTTGNIVTGVVTTLSGTTATYTTGNFTTGNIVTGVVTTLTSTNATLTNINSSGISTLGVTSTTNLTTQQLSVSGLTTFAGITTVTGTTLFAKQVNVSGVVTATTFIGSLTGTATSTTNIPNLSGDITSVNTVTTLTTVNGNVGTYGDAGAIPRVTVNAKGLVTGVSTVAPNNGTLTLSVSGTGLSGSSTFTANQSGNSTFTVTSNATSDNTNNTIVSRNASGGFSAGIITATQFSTGASGTGINITTNTLSGPAELIIDPSSVGDNTGAVRIKGDLYVDGTQTVINSTTIELADFNVGIATTIGTNALLDGAGIGIGSTNIRKTINWNNTLSALSSSENWNLASGKNYKIGGTDVLTSTTLGTSVVNSSLTSVGTLGQLNVSGVSTLGVTTFTGLVSFGTSAYFGDSDIAYFGDGNDLQILHDGTNSYVADYGVGRLVFASNGAGVDIVKAPFENIASFNTDGSVELYYDNSKEFETTGYGATVFGILQSQGLQVNTGVSTVGFLTATGIWNSGITTASAFIKIGGTSSQFLKADGSVDTNNYIAAETDTLNTVTNRGNTTTNGISVGVLTATSGNFSGIITSSGASIYGVVDATTFDGQVVSGLATITTLLGTTIISDTGNFTTGNIVTGVVTTLTSTNATLTNINSSGISTLGVTSTTNLTTQQLNVSGVSTFSGITTVTGTTLFAKQVNVSGVVTATTFIGALTGTATSTTNIPNLSGDVSSNNTVTTLATVNGNVGTYGDAGAIPRVTVNAKGLVTGVSTVAPNNGQLSLAVSGTGLSGSATFTANQSGNSTFTVTSNATSVNTVSTIVARDASGNFNAGIITATLSGNASSATYATSSGIATYATSSGIATYATTAGIASALTASASVNTTGIITASQFTTGSGFIGITTNTISGPAELIIDPAAVGNNTGLVRIRGDLYVDGTQTIINSSTIELADFNVGIATTVGTNALLDGAGIGIGSTGIRKTITWNNAASALTSSEDWNLVSGKQYEINGTSVLNATTLGSGVVNSSLTSVGTLGQLNVSGISTVGFLTATGIWNSGVTTSSAFVKIGGTSSQFLKADGSVDSNTYLTAFSETDTLNTVTTRGNTTTNGISVGVLTATSGNFSGIITSSGVNVSGVVTAVTFNGQVNAGVGTITTLSGTTATYTNANLTTLNVTTGNIVTGVVTTLTSTNVTLTNINSSGISTLGVTSTTNLTSQQLNVSGVSTFAGITTVTGTTLFAKQVNVSGISTFESVKLGNIIYDSNNNPGSSNYVLSSNGPGSPWSWKIVTETGAGILDAINVKVNGSDVGFGATNTTIDFYSSNITGTQPISGIASIRLTDTPTFTSYSTPYTLQGSSTSSTSSTSQVGIHSAISSTTYRSVEYMIQATEGSKFHTTKILVIHDGTTSYLTEYGTIYNDSILSTYDVDISGGNIRLLSTPASSGITTYMISFTATKA
jgi:hypothetical protein